MMRLPMDRLLETIGSVQMPTDMIIHPFRHTINFPVDRLQQISVLLMIPIVLST